MGKLLKHFMVVVSHKRYVMEGCFACGLYREGITHDLSKFSLIEFFASAQHFQGDKSPLLQEKNEKGFSTAWQHHKGHNDHHWQYWIDFRGGKIQVIRMPPKNLMHMLCDWAGAGKAYNKGKWTIDTFKNWYKEKKDTLILHKSTRNYIELLMANVKDEKDLYQNWINEKRIQDNYNQDIAEGCDYQPRYDLVETHLW